MRRHHLLLIFALALALRCYGLLSPLLDTHSWRQADTAAIARNFVTSHYQLSHPQIDWGGTTEGYVESEFPLYTGALALLFGAFGPHAWLGRLLTALISALTPLALYALVLAAGGQRRVAIYAALAMCVLPFPVYFGRTVMPDSLMLLLATLALWAFCRWLRAPSPARFALALALAALAPLAKTPNLLILAAPLAALVLDARPWRRWPQLLLYGLCFAAPVLLWTRHAATLPADARFSFGIGEKLFDRALLADSQFYITVMRWAVEDVATWAGAALAAAGALASLRARRWAAALPLAWLAGVALFLLVGAAGVIGQEYYVLPLAPPLAWLAALGLDAAQRWLAVRWRVAALALPVVALAAVVALSATRIAPMYRTADLYGQLGRRLDAALPQGARVGVIAPAVSELLYYAQRKGWRLDPGVIVPGGLASLGPDLGVRYVLITDPWLSERREQLAADLRSFRRIPVGPYALLLDLQQPGYAGEFEMAWDTGHVVEPPFLDLWRDMGGAAELGQPLSDALETGEGRVQYFERLVLLRHKGRTRFAPAGRWLLAARGQAQQPSAAASAFADAQRRYGLGDALGPVADGVQIFENGALQQAADGSVSFAPLGRWLLDARGLSEDAQLELSRAARH